MAADQIKAAFSVNVPYEITWSDSTSDDIPIGEIYKLTRSDIAVIHDYFEFESFNNDLHQYGTASHCIITQLHVNTSKHVISLRFKCRSQHARDFESMLSNIKSAIYEWMEFGVEEGEEQYITILNPGDAVAWNRVLNTDPDYVEGKLRIAILMQDPRFYGRYWAN